MDNNNFNTDDNNKDEFLNESIEGAKKEKKEKSPMREILEWVQAIAIAVVLAFVIKSFVFNVVAVSGDSMEGTLHNGDRMIVWRLGYSPKQGDIVVFRSPVSAEGNFWIKRVIATEGQHVRIDYDTNSVYVDDEKIDEPYINDCQCNDCGAFGGDDMIDRGFSYNDLTVPKGCIFVMGDNRNHSSDGRSIGTVSTKSVLGKAVLRFWPFNSIETY